MIGAPGFKLDTRAVQFSREVPIAAEGGPWQISIENTNPPRGGFSL